MGSHCPRSVVAEGVRRCFPGPCAEQRFQRGQRSDERGLFPAAWPPAPSRARVPPAACGLLPPRCRNALRVPRLPQPLGEPLWARRSASLG